jgi:hypothetical protein
VGTQNAMSRTVNATLGCFDASFRASGLMRPNAGPLVQRPEVFERLRPDTAGCPKKHGRQFKTSHYNSCWNGRKHACQADVAMGNVGSHGPVNSDAALGSAQKWLGQGDQEIAPGVFRSSDRLRQFRVTTRDLLPTHGNIGPHVHFEALDAAGNVVENLHLPVTP